MRNSTRIYMINAHACEYEINDFTKKTCVLWNNTEQNIFVRKTVI